MKKISILVLGLVIMTSFACKKVTQEYYTTPNQTVYYDLNASSFTTGDNGRTYKAGLSFQQGDIYQNDYDGVLVYISFDDNKTYEPVPQTFDGIAYGYIVTNQKVTLVLQSSDGINPINPPGNMKAKVVFIASQE